MNKVEAQVVKVFKPVTKETKSGDKFTTQNVLIEFNQNQEYPSRIVLQQGGEKGVKIASELTEGSYYTFHLNYRTNEWTNPNTGEETAFGSISTWKAEVLAQASSTSSDMELPY